MKTFIVSSMLIMLMLINCPVFGQKEICQEALNHPGNWIKMECVPMTESGKKISDSYYNKSLFIDSTGLVYIKVFNEYTNFGKRLYRKYFQNNTTENNTPPILCTFSTFIINMNTDQYVIIEQVDIFKDFSLRVFKADVENCEWQYPGFNTPEDYVIKLVRENICRKNPYKKLNEYPIIKEVRSKGIFL